MKIIKKATIELTENDIILAIKHYVADHYDLHPGHVEVDLQIDGGSPHGDQFDQGKEPSVIECATLTT